jgi:indole-3-glycerol phosphate synthase
MTGILEEIVADKRARLARGEYARRKPAGRPSDGAAFLASLREEGTRIVGEIKAKSPSAGDILSGADGRIENYALFYRRGRAAAISVVTEQDHFGGQPEWLPRAKSISGLPVLMKDFFVDERQLDFALDLGADAVLLIVRALTDSELTTLARAARERNLAAVVEVHDATDIVRSGAASPEILGVNARDLATFKVDFAVLETLAGAIPDGPVRLAESGVRTREDIERLSRSGYRAFLVGEALLRAEDPEKDLRTLRG